MMTRILASLLAPIVAIGVAGPALAQTDVSASATPAVAAGTGSANAAINPTGNAASSVNASGTIQLVPMGDLAAGANSFTEAQVRARIEGAGFTAVSRLEQDGKGIWRGQANRDGRALAVGFDFKGQIAAQ